MWGTAIGRQGWRWFSAFLCTVSPAHCRQPWATAPVQANALLKTESNCALKQDMKRNLKILIRIFHSPSSKNCSNDHQYIIGTIRALEQRDPKTEFWKTWVLIWGLPIISFKSGQLIPPFTNDKVIDSPSRFLFALLSFKTPLPIVLTSYRLNKNWKKKFTQTL